MGFENDLATAYSCSDYGLIWTFTIRTDAKFTNGKPVTAHDVAYTINGVASNEASECDLTMVDKAVAVDDETCEVHLNKPFNALLYTLAAVSYTHLVLGRRHLRLQYAGSLYGAGRMARAVQGDQRVSGRYHAAEHHRRAFGGCGGQLFDLTEGRERSSLRPFRYLPGETIYNPPNRREYRIIF